MLKHPKQQSEKLLNWAFVIALSLHAVALAGAACLPAEMGEEQLAEIRVFDSRVADRITPVDLVELPGEEMATAVRIAEPPIAREITRVEPVVAEQVRAEPKPTRHPLVTTTPAPRRQDQGRRPFNSAQGKQAPVQRNPAGPSGGGGGGGPVDLGVPSANGEPLGRIGGGTPMGGLPGEGAGSGSGIGSGSGGGSGSGSGGGDGSGRGSGSGPGTGSDRGEGSGESGFTSRVADRATPMVVHKGTLRYPPAALEDGVEGKVRLKVLVTELGTVSEVTVAQVSGDQRLDAAAVEFVKGWKYKPAVQDGKPRSVYTYAVVTFELR